MLVVMGASLKCSGSDSPSTLVVVRPNITAPMLPAGNIQDSKPFVNVPPFVMCKAPKNPILTAAKAATGATQVPCLPMLAGPWEGANDKVTIDNQPALHDGCTLECKWKETITVDDAGQTVVEVK